MIPIIVISHGNMAQGIKETVEMIVGKQEEVYFVSLRADNPEQFPCDIDEILGKYTSDKEILVLADLFGGSPFLTVAAKIMKDYPGARQVSGINLPMILECFFSRLSMNIDDLVVLAENTGKEGIKKLDIEVEGEVITDGI